ncbi:MAG: hypothetical protein EOO14_00170 [Chitinophagaceae bacterium]|nr:MAG: hypothetical protein EOO14_00170 [Chitinophagaceae bacterium]
MNRLKQSIFSFILFTMTVLTSSTCTADPLTDKALAELRSILKTQTEFVKVHAAEYLIWLGYPAEVRQEFMRENELHGTQPKYRITIWRVLAQTETDPSKKQGWYDKIYKAFGDVNGPDRLHAAETLAKLKLSPAERYPEATQKSLSDESRNLQVYTRWALSYAPGTNADEFRRDFLQIVRSDTNQVVRMISAFILRRSGGLTEAEWTELSRMALAESPESPLKKNLLNTAIVTFPAGAKKTPDYEKIRKAMLENYQGFSAGERMELAQALAEKGEASDLPLLTAYLTNENSAGLYENDSKEAADVRANAAYAIVKIKRRIEAPRK